MNGEPSCERLREAVTGRGTLDMSHLNHIHGPEVFNTFVYSWQEGEAIDKRSYVLFGMPHGRAKPPEIRDVESFYRMLRYSFANGSWTTWDNQTIPAEKRMAEMGRWLLEESTPDQIDILKKYRAGEITFQPEDEPLARLLYHFLLLVKNLERLPTRKELQEEYFQLKVNKASLSPSERKSSERWLEALGLDGLPEKYSGLYEWPLEPDPIGPFDAYRESSEKA